MSQTRNPNEPRNTQSNPIGGAGTGATDAGAMRESKPGSMTTTGSGQPSSQPGGGQPPSSGQANTAAAVQDQAKQYGQKIADAATQAKDYVSDKVTVVGDRLKDLQNKDVNQVTEEAKAYARQNPGQALLISAAAGFLLGLVIRSSGRR